METNNLSDIESLIRHSSKDESQRALRFELSRFASKVFFDSGTELHVMGHLLGPDRVEGTSPFGHGSDEAVAISLLLRIGSQLIIGAADLSEDGNHYAAGALIRQLVEVEYLSWAFEAKDKVAQQWLRSNRDDREKLFRPAALRKSANGKFRAVDYSYHCETGGHPVPKGSILLGADRDVYSQLQLSDMLGHVGRIWDHLTGWALVSWYREPILNRSQEMKEKFTFWKSLDQMVGLPPPPEKIL